MKQPIRAFAVGLFAAAVIMLIANYFSSGSKQEFSEMPIEDIVKELKTEGYRVLSESEYISLSMNGEVAKKETEVASAEVEEDETTEEPDTTEDAESTEENKEEKNNNQTESSEVASDNEESNSEQETAKNFTLKIEAGMPSSAISNELESNGIIDDSAEFISYLEDEGYAVRIQLGEFQLTSDMSYFEIAEALTK